LTRSESAIICSTAVTAARARAWEAWTLLAALAAATERVGSRAARPQRAADAGHHAAHVDAWNIWYEDLPPLAGVRLARQLDRVPLGQRRGRLLVQSARHAYTATNLDPRRSTPGTLVDSSGDTISARCHAVATEGVRKSGGSPSLGLRGSAYRAATSRRRCAFGPSTRRPGSAPEQAAAARLAGTPAAVDSARRRDRG
jgi:hypothetical protein